MLQVSDIMQYEFHYTVSYNFKLLNMAEKHIWTWWNTQIRSMQCMFFLLFRLWKEKTIMLLLPSIYLLQNQSKLDQLFLKDT